MGKYKLDDTVISRATHRVGRIINIGYSERSSEWLYVVEFKNGEKEKLLERDVYLAPKDSVLISEKEFDSIITSILAEFHSEDADNLLPIVGHIASTIKNKLFAEE